MISVLLVCNNGNKVKYWTPHNTIFEDLVTSLFFQGLIAVVEKEKSNDRLK